ncbi:MAG: hypothetical protein Unbinned1446contig1005_7 [Prokaryotic dsDNA virus sp.]|mgnify:CR=1 FL=1|nr:MAG: hypothetical protein Unbinned1446contig1005_7 [Prokaryotic dsDNA virus sp.]|tara:strand:+ start:3102 stop:3683 length:582 start_codon:yes stop_codon:yes gene_type:complete
MLKKQKFEEADNEAATDQHTALVEALTAMGLSAEQAEAVHTMAMDLIKANPATAEAEEPVAVEARRQRRNMGYGRKKKMRGRRRSRMHDDDDKMKMRRRRRSRMSAMEARRNRRRTQVQGRTKLSTERSIIARQRKEIAAMRKELAALNNAPAASKLSNNPLQNEAQNAMPSAPFHGSPKQRAFEMMKNMFTK